MEFGPGSYGFGLLAVLLSTLSPCVLPILPILLIVLMSTSLQQRFASATSGIGDAGNNFISQLNLNGFRGQFVIGMALGVVWSPCVGPTLGAAVMLYRPNRGLMHENFSVACEPFRRLGSS